MDVLVCGAEAPAGGSGLRFIHIFFSKNIKVAQGNIFFRDDVILSHAKDLA